MGIPIPIQRLREIATRLIDHVQLAAGETVVLPNDYFWSVPFPAAYEVYAEPGQLTVGQLSESWTNLDCASDEEDIAYSLVWLADVLRAIGFEVVR